MKSMQDELSKAEIERLLREIMLKLEDVHIVVEDDGTLRYKAT